MTKLQNSIKKDKVSKNKPRVSIGMPVRNGENFIREAIDSILAQTFKDFELIISDNASTDKTQEICKKYAKKDKRIRYYRNKKNLGGAYNFNRVFKLSKGKYFKWAAHDDVIAPEFLEKCVKVLDNKPSVMLCYTQSVTINKDGNPVRKCVNMLNLRSSQPHKRYKRFHDKVMRSDAPETFNPIFGLIQTNILKMTQLIGNYIGSDRVLLAELALRGKFYEIPELLFLRRVHPWRYIYPLNVSSNDEQAAWYDPSNKGKIILPEWRYLFEYLSVIHRVSISHYEKMCCYVQMYHWLKHYRGKMVKDIRSAGRKCLNFS